MHIDRLDADLIDLLTTHPQLPLIECARRLGVARGTVAARLERLQSRGVIRGIVPDVDPAGLGYGLVAFCTVQIIQSAGQEAVVGALGEAIPEIVDLYTVTGDADLLLRLVTPDTDRLQEVMDRIALVPGVARCSSSIALRRHLQGRLLPLVHRAAERGAVG